MNIETKYMESATLYLKGLYGYSVRFLCDMGTAIVNIWWGFCSVKYNAMCGPAGMFSYFNRLNIQCTKR